MDDKELYWLAGLLEGEGSFLAGPPSAPNSVRIVMTMTDVDVIQRVASLWRVAYNAVGRDRCREHGWKQHYFVHLRGKRAVELMQRLHPLIGERRRSQIERALASYDPNLRSKLTREQVTEIKAKVAEGLKQSEIAQQYGVDRSTVSHIKAGVRPSYR